MNKALLTLLITLSASGAAWASGTSAISGASTKHTFKYRNNLTITVQAPNRTTAYPLAASQCFQHLTGGKYPGEDVVLYIIDICANPVRF